MISVLPLRLLLKQIKTYFEIATVYLLFPLCSAIEQIKNSLLLFVMLKYCHQVFKNSPSMRIVHLLKILLLKIEKLICNKIILKLLVKMTKYIIYLHYVKHQNFIYTTKNLKQKIKYIKRNFF